MLSAPIKLFSGTATRYLAEKIADSYGITLGRSLVQHFADGEFGYGTKIAGDCEIQDGVIFSSSVIENAKTRVGRGAMIQAGTTFSKDVPPYIICTKRSEYGGVNFTMGRNYGVDEKILKHIANAYRLIYLGNTSLFDAVNQIEDQVPDSPEIRNVIEFMRSTKLGVIAKM